MVLFSTLPVCPYQDLRRLRYPDYLVAQDISPFAPLLSRLIADERVSHLASFVPCWIAPCSLGSLPQKHPRGFEFYQNVVN